MTTKLRPEVAKELYATGPAWSAILKWGDRRVVAHVEEVGHQLLALVELGVRLGVAYMVGEGTHRDVAKKVVADILQAQPGEERS